MHGTRNLRAIVCAIAATGLMAVFGTGAAAAAGLKVCVPGVEGKPIVTPKAGVCKAGYTLTELGAEGKEGKEGPAGKEGPPGKEGPAGKEGPQGKEGKAGKTGPEGKSPFTAEETATLKAILPYIKLVSIGVGGKPTIQFSGANVQVVNGSGKQATGNGLGNLVVGYDESPGSQTGSHNIVLGSQQTYEGIGGLIGGEKNYLGGTGNFVLGFENKANGFHFASILGGRNSTSSAEYSTVGGGYSAKAEGFASFVAGGFENSAPGNYGTVLGGGKNKATGPGASVFGGELNIAGGENAGVFGGDANEASGKDSAILGGKLNKVTTEYGHTP
ncbi:MAG TPA: hypothetical protein VLJ80_09360 [Solirubrobacteraceae bacterium]|nr:hypothetical protein [Solirubrobacteraceae bacterium]